MAGLYSGARPNCPAQTPALLLSNYGSLGAEWAICASVSLSAKWGNTGPCWPRLLPSVLCFVLAQLCPVTGGTVCRTVLGDVRDS